MVATVSGAIIGTPVSGGVSDRSSCRMARIACRMSGSCMGSRQSECAVRSIASGGRFESSVLLDIKRHRISSILREAAELLAGEGAEPFERSRVSDDRKVRDRGCDETTPVPDDDDDDDDGVAMICF